MMIADEAGISREIMTFLVDNQVIANMNDLCLITVDAVGSLRAEYDGKLEAIPDQKNVWTFLVSSQLRFLIELFNSYH